MKPTIKPMLKLSKAERLYWPILAELRTTDWTDADNLLASQMCRDLGTLEELAKSDDNNLFMPEVCGRLYEGLHLLNLRQAPENGKPKGIQRKVIDAIFEGA